MTLSTIFAKPIDRPIEGVIKADDNTTLKNEIEEYVITNELEKRLEHFFEAYHNYQGANGVWISGFFGSGKSHLLKMLALLLENQSVDDIQVVNSFLEKCEEDNQFLLGQLQKIITIPAQSILFNIDQKADVISKNQIDALLAVFVKVFDETCGYYGKQGHIAKFERDLDSRGLYESFQQTYQEIAGHDWEFGREQAIFESDNIAQAYAQITNTDGKLAQGILDKYRSEYKLSIEDFAEQVKTYIDKQSPSFRLNFFVDEVGQYIADNVKLMTNLQTIAESLATKCRGRAWIIVTAQEDMDNVLGEQSKQQSNDFSKIQARFANRMKLTSADVAEVIQKRLLSKNSQGVNLLSAIYQQQSNNFKTLFDFTDGSQTYRNFQEQEHFINTYPFVPYQFDLFQSAIQNLSIHNAFEGKHSSVGERSMLGVFQQVAITIRDYQLGQLATFDLMFEGISSVLKSGIQKSILTAEKNLDDAFAIKVLKVLFLVKYVREFRSTVRNLTVLILDHFDGNVAQLQKKVESALNLLEQQTYIQRQGEIYEYLTDEEKDIEQEIKNTAIENESIYSELNQLIFERIIKTKKIKSESNQQEYSFSRKIDNRFYGRESELSIHIITPFHENAQNIDILKGNTMGKDELLIVIPPDDRLIREIMMYQQTEKYVRQNLATTEKASVKNILSQKQAQNTERYEQLQQRLQGLLSQARLIINGSEIEIAQSEASNRIVKAFQELITTTYPNLKMLRGEVYTEAQVKGFIYNSTNILPDNLAESEREVFAYIQTNKKNSLRTTVSQVIDKFSKKPYGWHQLGITGTIAKLITYNKLEARQNSNLLEKEDLETALLKSSNHSTNHSTVILEPQIDFSPSQVRNLKEFYNEFFHQPPAATEAKPLAQETKKALIDLITNMESLVTGDSYYPFQDKWLEAISFLKTLQDQSYDWYLTDLTKEEDKLFDLKEDVIDPILAFLKGQQREIFDHAYNFVNEQKTNFNYIQAEEIENINGILTNSQCFKGNLIQQLKVLLDSLKDKISQFIATEINTAQEQIEVLKNKLLSLENFSQLNPQQQEKIRQPLIQLSEKLTQETLIPVIRDKIRSFEENDYTQLLKQIDTWIGKDGKGIPEYISSRSITVNFSKSYLSDRSDVETYLELMKEALLKEIEAGKRIQI